MLSKQSSLYKSKCKFPCTRMAKKLSNFKRVYLNDTGLREGKKKETISPSLAVQMVHPCLFSSSSHFPPPVFSALHLSTVSHFPILRTFTTQLWLLFHLTFFHFLQRCWKGKCLLFLFTISEQDLMGDISIYFFPDYIFVTFRMLWCSHFLHNVFIVI